MTRLVSFTDEHSEQARRMKSAFDENQPSDAQILNRMARLRVQSDSARFLPRRRLVPVIWGAVAGTLLCGSALAWAFKTGLLQWDNGGDGAVTSQDPNEGFEKIGRPRWHAPPSDSARSKSVAQSAGKLRTHTDANFPSYHELNDVPAPAELPDRPDKTNTTVPGQTTLKPKATLPSPAPNARTLPAK